MEEKLSYITRTVIKFDFYEAYFIMLFVYFSISTQMTQRFFCCFVLFFNLCLFFFGYKSVMHGQWKDNSK